MYYDKWWKSQGRESEETACLSSKSSSQETVANALGVVNIGGIFVVLARIQQSEFIKICAITGGNTYRLKKAVKFVPDVAYHFCWVFPATFTQPGARLLAGPRTYLSSNHTSLPPLLC